MMMPKTQYQSRNASISSKPEQTCMRTTLNMVKMMKRKCGSTNTLDDIDKGEKVKLNIQL